MLAHAHMSHDTTPEEVERLIREHVSAEEEQAWLGLLETHERLVREIHRQLVAQHRLPLSTFETLVRIAHAEEGEIAIRDLAHGVMLSPSQVSRLVIELEREGLVERRRNPSDARSTRAAITSQGKALLREATPTYLTTIRRLLLDQLSKREVGQLASLWRRLAKRAAAPG